MIKKITQNSKTKKIIKFEELNFLTDCLIIKTQTYEFEKPIKS